MHEEPFTLRNDEPARKSPKQQQLTIWCETDGERPAVQKDSLVGQQDLFEPVARG